MYKSHHWSLENTAPYTKNQLEVPLVQIELIILYKILKVVYFVETECPMWKSQSQQ